MKLFSSRAGTVAKSFNAEFLGTPDSKQNYGEWLTPEPNEIAC
jgi:hypothetical protein